MTDGSHRRAARLGEPLRRGAQWRFAAGLAIGAATMAAQSSSARAGTATKAWVAARTPDGHPDFQGVWANNTVTPLQRPKQWEGKTRLTDSEIAELQRIAQQIYDNDGDAQFGDGLILAVLEKITNPGSYDPGTGNYNQFWLVGRDWHDRRTALITNPADGKIPALTPEAQKRRTTEMERATRWWLIRRTSRPRATSWAHTKTCISSKHSHACRKTS